MASETSRKAERVFCQHVLKPIPDEPGAYRCDRCGQVGDMRGRSIVWRQTASRVNRRTARTTAVLLGGLACGLACGLSVVLAGPAHMKPVDATAALQPIPLDEMPEDGCCGGGPQLIPTCTVCFTYEIAGLGEFQVCDSVECRGRFNLCKLKALFRLANGHYIIQAECVDIRNFNRREIERII